MVPTPGDTVNLTAYVNGATAVHELTLMTVHSEPGAEKRF